jgi:Domain of unknown function (DUF4259)
MKRLFVLLMLLCLSSVAMAGTWGEGSFDNDDALDWVAKCTKTSNTTVVSTSIEAALKSPFIEAPEGSEAVAAAEVIAAAMGKPNPKIPSEISTWLEHQPKPDLIKLATHAILALERIKDPKTSELSQLWSEEKTSNWLSKISELGVRLGRKPNPSFKRDWLKPAP